MSLSSSSGAGTSVGAPDHVSPPLLFLAPVLPSLSVERLLIAAAASLVAGVMNSIAGGGTLLTFPILVAAGLSPLIANATSTVALLPGAPSSMLGYRGELTGARRWTVSITLPSFIGGVAGAWLLLHTPGRTFDQVVPWLVLGATSLLIAQRPLLRWTRRHATAVADDTSLTAAGPTPLLLGWQAVLGVYGGYFGAGVGILMLAALGFMGFTNLHRMNGLKNWGAFCMNLVAAIIFSVSGLVVWRVALPMGVAAVIGGYIGSRVAQRISQDYVRATVAVIGLGSGFWMLLRHA